MRRGTVEGDPPHEVLPQAPQVKAEMIYFDKFKTGFAHSRECCAQVQRRVRLIWRCTFAF